MLYTLDMELHDHYNQQSRAKLIGLRTLTAKELTQRFQPLQLVDAIIIGQTEPRPLLDTSGKLIPNAPGGNAPAQPPAPQLTIKTRSSTMSDRMGGGGSSSSSTKPDEPAKRDDGRKGGMSQDPKTPLASPNVPRGGMNQPPSNTVLAIESASNVSRGGNAQAVMPVSSTLADEILKDITKESTNMDQYAAGLTSLVNNISAVNQTVNGKNAQQLTEIIRTFNSKIEQVDIFFDSVKRAKIAVDKLNKNFDQIVDQTKKDVIEAAIQRFGSKYAAVETIGTNIDLFVKDFSENVQKQRKAAINVVQVRYAKDITNFNEIRAKVESAIDSAKNALGDARSIPRNMDTSASIADVDAAIRNGTTAMSTIKTAKQQIDAMGINTTVLPNIKDAEKELLNIPETNVEQEKLFYQESKTFFTTAPAYINQIYEEAIKLVELIRQKASDRKIYINAQAAEAQAKADADAKAQRLANEAEAKRLAAEAERIANLNNYIAQFLTQYDIGTVTKTVQDQKTDLERDISGIINANPSDRTQPLYIRGSNMITEQISIFQSAIERMNEDITSVRQMENASIMTDDLKKRFDSFYVRQAAITDIYNEAIQYVQNLLPPLNKYIPPPPGNGGNGGQLETDAQREEAKRLIEYNIHNIGLLTDDIRTKMADLKSTLTNLNMMQRLPRLAHLKFSHLAPLDSFKIQANATYTQFDISTTTGVEKLSIGELAALLYYYPRLLLEPSWKDILNALPTKYNLTKWDISVRRGWSALMIRLQDLLTNKQITVWENDDTNQISSYDFISDGNSTDAWLRDVKPGFKMENIAKDGQVVNPIPAPTNQHATRASAPTWLADYHTHLTAQLPHLAQEDATYLILPTGLAEQVETQLAAGEPATAVFTPLHRYTFDGEEPHGTGFTRQAQVRAAHQLLPVLHLAAPRMLRYSDNHEVLQYAAAPAQTHQNLVMHWADSLGHATL